MKHEGGSLPFAAEISTDLFNFDDENRITIAVDNTLSNFTVPQGQSESLSYHRLTLLMLSYPSQQIT